MDIPAVKTYRFPNVSTSYSQRVARLGHIRSSISRLSSCLIDTPRDEEQRYRDTLLSYQKHHRGIRGSDEPLPDIPFRLRAGNSDTVEIRKGACPDDVAFPVLDSFRENTFFQQSPRTHSSTESDKMLPSSDPKFVAKDSSIPFAKSVRLCSRENGKYRFRSSGGSVSERLPKMPCLGSEISSPTGFTPITPVPNLIQEGPINPTRNHSDFESSTSIDIDSDNIGHTTHNSVDTRRTLADILNKNNTRKYSDLSSKGTKSVSINSDTHIMTDLNTEIQWFRKFETKLIDGKAYDNFARTRKSDLDKDFPKSDIVSGKPGFDEGFADKTGKDGRRSRKNSITRNKKYSKLKLAQTVSKLTEE